MSDGFDWHFPLLALLAAAAIFPAREVSRFVRSLMAPRDITQPPLPPLTGAERKRLLLSAAALPMLLVVAVLVAFSPRPLTALPAIIGGVAIASGSILSGFRAVRGLRTGTAVFKGRGFTGTYRRSVQPLRFWFATAANGLFSAWFGLIALAVLFVAGSPDTQPPPSCFIADTMSLDHCSVIVHQREIRALSKEIAADPDDATAIEKRARLYESDDDLDLARADWDRLRLIRARQGRPLTGG